MIPFDTFTLAAVAAELRALVLGAKVQKVQQPSPSEVVLSMFGRAGSQRLLLSADPQRARAHLTQMRRENPVTPPGFCQVCRKYLEGARLDQIVMPRFDRVLHLVFHAHDGERMTLAAELMGRNANLILVGGAGQVRGVIRPAPAGTERPLRPGAPYTDPPGSGERADPLTEAAGESPPADSEPRAWLMTTYSGIGRFAADEVVARAGAAGGVGEALAALMDDVRAGRFAPHSISDATGSTEGVWAFEPLSVPAGRRFPRESVSVALDTFFATVVRQAAEETERGRLSKAIAREIAYREREIVSARATLAEAGRAEQQERTGNLLLAHLAQVRPGAGSVTVPDLYGEGDDVTIALDPKRSPHENAQSYFDRARKARDAADYAEGRLEDLQTDLAALQALAAQVEKADEGGDYEALRHALSAIVGAERAAAAGAATAGPGTPQRAKEKPFGGHRIRVFAVDGYELLVGETAEANDYLTTRVAAPSDLWLHVRAGTGAHGVLRTAGKPRAVPEAVLRQAAQIVATRSGKAVKHASLVAVDVVEKRHVRKPRGAKPGLVTYSQERSLDVFLGILPS